MRLKKTNKLMRNKKRNFLSKKHNKLTKKNNKKGGFNFPFFTKKIDPDLSVNNKHFSVYNKRLSGNKIDPKICVNNETGLINDLEICNQEIINNPSFAQQVQNISDNIREKNKIEAQIIYENNKRQKDLARNIANQAKTIIVDKGKLQPPERSPPPPPERRPPPQRSPPPPPERRLLQLVQGTPPQPPPQPKKNIGSDLADAQKSIFYKDNEYDEDEGPLQEYEDQLKENDDYKFELELKKTGYEGLDHFDYEGKSLQTCRNNLNSKYILSEEKFDYKNNSDYFLLLFKDSKNPVIDKYAGRIYVNRFKPNLYRVKDYSNGTYIPRDGLFKADFDENEEESLTCLYNVHPKRNKYFFFGGKTHKRKTHKRKTHKRKTHKRKTHKRKSSKVKY